MAVEVKTKLTLDDNASSSLSRIRDAFNEVTEEQEDAQSSLHEFGQEMLAVAGGVNLVPMLLQIKDTAMGMANLALEAQNTKQSFAGMMAGMQGIPWAEAQGEASALYDELQNISIQLGQNSTDIREGFNSITTFLGGTESAFNIARDQIENISTIANVTGLSVREIGMEYGRMAAGFLSTESAVFNLIRGTGVFGESLEGLAAGWTKMTQAERLDALNYAMRSMSDNLSKASPTVTDMVTSMQELGKMTIETIGQPIVESLMPVLQAFRQDLISSRGEIELYARKLGREVGAWVKEAGETIREGFEYIRTHHEEIRDAIVDAFGTARQVVRWILEHKEELAYAFGAKAVLGSGVGQGAISTVSSVAKMGSAGTSVGGRALSGVGGAATALGAFAAAVGGATLAVDQYAKLQAETGGGKSEAEMEFEAINDAFKRWAARPDVAEWNEVQRTHFMTMRENLIEVAIELGKNVDAAKRVAKATMDAHKAMRGAVEMYEDMAFQAEEAAARPSTPESMDALVMMSNEFADGIISANNRGATAQAKYIAGILAGSSSMHDAFVNSTELTEDAYNMIADMVEGKSEELAKLLRERGEQVKKQTETPEAPKLVLTGGQTFNIKQDFRDQDPDRIAVVFQRDVTRLAERRLQAATGSPFGT